MNSLHKVGSPATAPTQINVGPSYSSRLMDSNEAAEYLRLEPRLIKEWARKGYLPAHPLGLGERKIWRFFEHELVEWLNGQTKLRRSR